MLQEATKAMQEVLTRQVVGHQTRADNERHHQIISPCTVLVSTWTIVCKTALVTPKQSPLKTSVPFIDHCMHQSEYEM